MSTATTTEIPASRRRLPPGVISVGAPIVGAIIGLLIGALLMMIAQIDPLLAYKTMLQGAFGGERQVTETLLKTAPLLIIGLGLAVAFRARVWNIGAEGQYFIGAILGGIVALYLADLPRLPLILLIMLAGIVGGGLWALIPAIFKTKFGINEIISTLMLNYIAMLLLAYLARGPLQEPGGYLPCSAKFDPITRLPLLFGTRVHLGVVLAFVLVPIIYILIWKTPIGFRARAVGSRASVARYAGINVEGVIIFVLIFSGALAGLAGIMETCTLHFRLKTGISGGYGFSAILVALLGRMNPIGIAVASLLFAILIIGAETMHVVAGVPPELADAIQAVIVLSVLAVDALVRRRIV